MGHLNDEVLSLTDGKLNEWLIDAAAQIDRSGGRLTAHESADCDYAMDRWDAGLAEYVDRKAAKMLAAVMEPGLVAVIAARIAQERKGFDAEHDDEHTNYELLHAARFLLDRECYGEMSGLSWPFTEEPPAEDNQVAMAAALVVAELDRRARRVPKST